MKVALVLCPSWGIETPHLGIALLAAALRKYNHQVAICDFNIQVHNKYKEEGLWKSEEDVHWEDTVSISKFIDKNNDLLNSFVEQVVSTDAQIIGFSIYNTTRRLSLELAKRIKNKDRNKIIVFGGQQCFPEAAAEWLIKDESVDVVVMGEGDEALPELIGKIENSGNIDFCPGVVSKRDGKIIDCGIRSPITNLDNLSFPDFSDFMLSSYDNPFQLPLLSSRGCPYTCVFCSTKLFWIKFRSMSGDRIFQEIAYQLNKYKNVHFFTFNDHVINANIQSLARLCDLLLEAKSERGKSNSNWEKLSWRGAAMIRPELTFDFLKKMKESGCIELEYGIESGSQRILDKMKKRIDIEVAQRVIRDTYRAGISVRANFMFGFPGETEEDYQRTLDFLKRNREVFTQVHPSETFCHIDPGTYLFEHLDEFDVSLQPLHSLYWESINGKNTYPERLRRHQLFCQLATSLNIPLSPGGHKIILHSEYFLEEFRRYKETNFEAKEKIQISAPGFVPADDASEKKKTEDKPTRVLSWILHYDCDYRCPYCLYYNRWQDPLLFKKYEPFEKWIKSWHRIYEKFGSIYIKLIGGEPFIYPSFTLLMKELLKEHIIEIKTNLSCNIDYLSGFITQIDNFDNLKMLLTFHPLFSEFDSFAEKVSFLKVKGLADKVVYFAYPPQIKQINYYKEKFDEGGILLSISPFFGRYQGVNYPEGYTREEMKIITDNSLIKGDTGQNWLTAKETHACLGFDESLLVHPDGKVTTCDKLRVSELAGNFFDENFKFPVSSSP